MIRWAVLFFLVAIVAAVFGFGGFAQEAAWFGKILCGLFLILFVISLLLGRKAPPRLTAFPGKPAGPPAA
jgi:uncharacterized membrane protein YtjA (UPF0391 family)